jgi:hypothetical protein
VSVFASQVWYKPISTDGNWCDPAVDQQGVIYVGSADNNM